MHDDQVELIKKNAQLIIEKFRPLSGIEFGLNRASVEWLEGFIERQRVGEDFDQQRDEKLVSILGSFLGEAIIANAGGEWRFSDTHGWSITFSNGDSSFPFAKVEKAFLNGLAGGDSILSFYDVSVDLVAKGKLASRYSSE